MSDSSLHRQHVALHLGQVSRGSVDPLGEDVVLVGLVEARAWLRTLVADKEAEHVVSGPVLRHSIMAGVQQLREDDVAEVVRPLGDQLQGVLRLLGSARGRGLRFRSQCPDVLDEEELGSMSPQVLEASHSRCSSFSCTGGHAIRITVIVQLRQCVALHPTSETRDRRHRGQAVGDQVPGGVLREVEQVAEQVARLEVGQYPRCLPLHHLAREGVVDLDGEAERLVPPWH